MAREMADLREQIIELKRDVREAQYEKLRLEAECESLMESLRDQQVLVEQLKDQVNALEDKVRILFELSRLL